MRPPTPKNPLMTKILGYFSLALFVAFIIAIAILLSYVLVWIVVIALILFAFGFVRAKYFPNKMRHSSNKSDKPAKGRIIEHDDIK